MNKYRSLSDQKKANWIMRSFVLSFLAFCFVFLFTIEKDLMLAVGTALFAETSFSLFSSHVLLTFVVCLLIWLVQPLVRTLLHCKVSKIVATYIPAFIVFIVFILLGHQMKSSQKSLVWLSCGLVILDFILVWALMFVHSLRRVDPRYYNRTGIYQYTSWIITNVFLFIVLAVVSVICVSNNLKMPSFKFPSDNNVAESDTIKAIKKKKDKGEMLTSLEKTIMFNNELYKHHVLGDSLFCYRQHFKSQGLGRKDTYTSDTKDSVVYDYHMATLLLNKDLKTFCEDLKRYHVFHKDSFPASYTEAFILYKYKNPGLRAKIHNPYFKARFQRYLRYSIDNHIKSQKYEFGNTFWWYYDHE